MDPDLIPCLPDGTPLSPDALSWSFSRASGPGGQHVNRTESRVQLSVELERLPDELAAAIRRRLPNRIDGQDRLTVTATGHRSQLQNRRQAVERLEQLLRQATRHRKRRRRTRPPRASKEQRLAEKKQRSETKRLRGRIEEMD